MFITVIIFNSCFSIPLSAFFNITIVNNTGEDIRAAFMYMADRNSNSIFLFTRDDPVLANGTSKTFSLSRIDVSVRQILSLSSVNNNYYDILIGVINSSLIVTFTQAHLRAEQQSETGVAATPSTPALYKIGDIGPAGGIIFYDKGNNSNGWRYLEAAPVDAETRAQWSVRNTRVENTQEGIGNGRRNTQLIIEAFTRAIGEWDTAAQYCDDLEFNGFDDWFLPSKDELDQMYGNLKRRNLGDFKNEIYYSSTSNSDQWASGQNFSDGTINIFYKSDRRYVRPIRQVAHP